MVAPDWSELPRELVCRIWFYYELSRAATTIQAYWRGRDVRHFLNHPASRVFNSRHPKFEIDCHERRCFGCLLQALYMHNLRYHIFTSVASTGVWSIRCLYLVGYDPERVTYHPLPRDPGPDQSSQAALAPVPMELILSQTLARHQAQVVCL